MDDDALQAAIRALKLEDPDLTVKGIHAALEATGDRIELSVVKKAAGKVTKALAQEATKEKLNPPLPVPVKEAEGTSSTARKQQSTLPSARKQRAETASLREPTGTAVSAADGAGGRDRPKDVKAYLMEIEKQITSRSAAEFGLEGGLLGKVLPCLAPTATTEVSSLAARVLTAVSMHDGLTEKLLDGGVLPPLLQRIPTSPDSLAILILTLLHNLADTPATRRKLVVGGALSTVTRSILDPGSSDELKEHCLTAVASMAGLAAEAVSFPQAIGILCASEADVAEPLRAMRFMVDRPELRGGLARLEEVQSGLRAASNSPNPQAATEAAEMLKLLTR